MSDTIFHTVALVLYFAAMLFIGWFAYRKTNNLDDFVIGDRGLRPSVAALSAGASDMSGWLLMGLPGAIYFAGLSKAWIAIGLLIGAWTNWKIVAPRLRAYTEVAKNSLTIPSFFENRLHDKTRLLRIFSSLIILVFFTFYVSSGMVAAGIFFESSFNSSYYFGMFLVASITLLYTMFGGFLGATLTDVVQGLLLVAALVVVPVAVIFEMGSVQAAFKDVGAVDGDHLNLFAGISALGIVSALAWGLGYFGQPHILVRFMALRKPSEAALARRIGMSWMFVAIAGAVVSSLVAVSYSVLHPDLMAGAVNEPETVFLVLSKIMLHPFVGGFVLAAVLAAVMSTLSSQLVVCSSALVEDLYKIVRKKPCSNNFLVWFGRLGVAAVAAVAMLLALDRSSSVLGLVGFAWSGFGAAFGPIILLSLFWRKLSYRGALCGMVSGAVTVFVWGSISSLSDALFEIVPGFFVCLFVAVVVSLFTGHAREEIGKQFDQALVFSGK